VVVTDYASVSDRVLVDAIQVGGDDSYAWPYPPHCLLASSQKNIDSLSPAYVSQATMSATGYVWGQPVQPLLDALGEGPNGTEAKFQVTLLASPLDQFLWCPEQLSLPSDHCRLSSWPICCSIDQNM
jgi:hypothetical protein